MMGDGDEEAVVVVEKSGFRKPFTPELPSLSRSKRIERH
jgi:hypothetical protein